MGTIIFQEIIQCMRVVVKLVDSAQTCVSGRGPKILTFMRFSELDHTCDVDVK